jgi:branched-subunit amino acid aminotransferase/4-amino-4-deoxychorismate lyase
MDADGYITETATGTILVQLGEEWITPEAQGVLPGITLKMLRSLWENQGRTIKERRITLDEMSGADRVWILNSLIGIMPVKNIDQYVFSRDSQSLAERSRHELWEYAKILS